MTARKKVRVVVLAAAKAEATILASRIKNDPRLKVTPVLTTAHTAVRDVWGHRPQAVLMGPRWDPGVDNHAAGNPCARFLTNCEIARNLVRSGLPVVIFDLSDSACGATEFQNLGAEFCTPFSLVQDRVTLAGVLAQQT